MKSRVQIPDLESGILPYTTVQMRTSREGVVPVTALVSSFEVEVELLYADGGSSFCLQVPSSQPTYPTPCTLHLAPCTLHPEP